MSVELAPTSSEIWEISDRSAKLTQYACSIGAQHLKDDVLRTKFTCEISSLGEAIVEDVRSGSISFAQGAEAIEREYAELYAQVWEYSKLVAGFTAGVLQLGTGVAVCKASLGLGCAAGGIPLILHGINNIYENGVNFIERRSDAVGPVRSGYQHLAMLSGGAERQGNIAYGVMDIGLSAFSLGRMVLRPGTWRLFRYLESDRIRAYQEMGKGALMFEVGVDMLTGEQVIVEWERQ